MRRELFIEHEEIAETVIKEKERLEMVHDLIQELLDNHVEIGRGKLSVIKKFPDNDKYKNFCVKEITGPSSPYYFNDIYIEMRRQAEAFKLGIRVPEPFLTATPTEGKEFFVMETIEGCSLEDIVAKNINLPDNFNPEIFWNKIKKMLEIMHNNNLYHRDIHLGNIMIEWKTGNPVLIDFGNAGTGFGLEDPYNEIESLRGEVFRFPEDIESLRQIKNKFNQHLTEKNR